MKAIRASVSFHDWSKVEGFLDQFKYESAIFAYMVDNVTFIAVFSNECTMAYFKAELVRMFDDEVIIVELR